jgi:hypothetical protein
MIRGAFARIGRGEVSAREPQKHGTANLTGIRQPTRRSLAPEPARTSEAIIPKHDNPIGDAEVAKPELAYAADA